MLLYGTEITHHSRHNGMGSPSSKVERRDTKQIDTEQPVSPSTSSRFITHGSEHARPTLHQKAMMSQDRRTATESEPEMQ